MDGMYNLYKYSDDTVIKEADMFLSGAKLSGISAALNIPKSTISWHLMHPLMKLDFDKWVQVRKKLNKFAKDKQRVHINDLFIETFVSEKSMKERGIVLV